MTAAYLVLQMLTLACLVFVTIWLVTPVLGRWRTVRRTGAWHYQEHSRSGARRVLPLIQGGYQPIDLRWLAGGDWSVPPDRGPSLPVRPAANPVSPDYVRRG